MRSLYKSHIHNFGDTDEKFSYFITNWEFDNEEKKFKTEKKFKQSLYVWGSFLKPIMKYSEDKVILCSSYKAIVIDLKKWKTRSQYRINTSLT